MGSGASSAVNEVPGGDLRLPASGLRFTNHQLRSLNSYVDTLHEEDQRGRMTTETEYAIESLVQRIVDGAGQRDPRFRCCHLIALHRGKKMRSRSLEYLVTLDSLPILNSSEECVLQEGPVGYGRVRLSGREADKWEEFLSPTGYLYRDKVIDRWVELIARCANARGGGASRGVSSLAAGRLRPYHYCYLERVSAPQTSNERRLAIVEGAAWVMVRVGTGLAGEQEGEAKLMLGARVEGCSANAYTCRIPITHPLALLHYTSAQSSYYAVAVGPPVSLSCSERSSTWQLWNPSLEASLDSHYSELSVIARVAGALNALVDRMREGIYQGSLCLLSRYMVACALRHRLDRCSALKQTARYFASTHASYHLLLILDSLVSVCERGGVAGYVYGVTRDAVPRAASRGVWRGDAATLRACLLHLQRIPGDDIPLSPSESLEAALFNRWDNLNREAKASGATSYSRRQLKYLWRVASELVKCKNMIYSENQSTFRANLIQVTSLNQESVEDLIHILAIMLDQARDLYLNNMRNRNVGEFDRELSIYRSKKWNKLKDYYDASSAYLIDAVRRDSELRKENLKDEVTLMKNILNWLQRGARDDKKYLGPVLKPYLEGLFNVSLENTWFLEDFDQKRCDKEYESLKEYCMEIHNDSVEPCMGLLDEAKKFAWAKAMVDFIDRFKHIDFRLVFPTGEGMAISFPIKLPSRTEHSSARIITLSRRDKDEAKLRLARRCVLAAFNTALVGERSSHSKVLTRHSSTDEILASVKSGNYWRNSTKPDIVTSASIQDISTADVPKVRRRSRRQRPVTTYQFPEISISNQCDVKTMRRKYHTLKSLVYTEPVENIKELRRRPRSAGSTVRNKDTMSRPSILETLDFINSVKDALCLEESGASDVEDVAWSTSDEWLLGQTAPLNLLAARSGGVLHLCLGDLVPALMHRGKFTIVQELCSRVGEASEGALFALHRVARASRSRSSERSNNSWKLPEGQQDVPQKYRTRPPDYVSGDEAPQPPPLPRKSSKDIKVTKRYTDYLPPKRIQDLEHNLSQLELANPKPNVQNLPNSDSCTGIINPIYDIRMPRDKFSVKRSKSLGRTFSNRRLGAEVARYNITLGPRSGKKTNDVVTAITGMTGETGLDPKSNFFQKYSNDKVIGDSYRVSRITID